MKVLLLLLFFMYWFFSLYIVEKCIDDSHSTRSLWISYKKIGKEFKPFYYIANLIIVPIFAVSAIVEFIIRFSIDLAKEVIKRGIDERN